MKKKELVSNRFKYVLIEICFQVKEILDTSWSLKRKANKFKSNVNQQRLNIATYGQAYFTFLV